MCLDGVFRKTAEELDQKGEAIEVAEDAVNTLAHSGRPMNKTEKSHLSFASKKANRSLGER